ncbi:retrovirus-related pol polyprotein from transposon 17.6 [Tanacetum coccineum]
MPIDTPPSPYLVVLGDEMIDLLLRDDLDTLSMGDRDIDFNPCRDIEELERLLANDPIPFPRESEDSINSLDPICDSSFIAVTDTLIDSDFDLGVDLGLSKIVAPLSSIKKMDIRLREVERFDLFFSLTQSGEETRVMENPSFGFYHMSSPRPAAYSPKEVMYCYYHPHLTTGDGFNPETRRFLKIVKTRACFQSSNRPVFDLLLILESSILIMHPPVQKDAIKAMIRELLESEVIKHSQSSFASPVVMVKKKDTSWRMCVDYRQLNKHTIKDKFLIPVIEELIMSWRSCDLFQGHYEFLVMPFGLTNAPSTFQALMNDVFKEFLRKFTLMKANSLYAKKVNVCWGLPSCGSIWALLYQSGGYSSSKVQAMKTWPIPKTLTQFKGYDYEVIYKQGKDNAVADALSRRGDIGELLAISTTSVSTELYDRVVQALEKGKLVTGNNDSLRKDLLSYFHYGAIGGHSGYASGSSFLSSASYMECLNLLYQIGIGYSSVPFGRNCENPKDWFKWLPLAELWYNSNYHSSIDTTPIEALYGQPPPVHVPYVGGLSKVDAVDRSLVAREQAIATLTFHLARDQNRMKQQTDKHICFFVYFQLTSDVFWHQSLSTLLSNSPFDLLST